MCRRPFAMLLPTTIAIVLSTTLAVAQGKNLLFYGNSYSYYNGSVADVVQRLAIEAGLPAPTIVKRLFPGETMHYHATDPGQVAAISTSLPVGRQWDVVVMQGHSLEATSTLGDPVTFRQSAVQVVANVLAHSPAARAVLYQTWSRGHGHQVYPTQFAVPLDMHRQVRQSYRAAVHDIDVAHGVGTAERAAVGDAMALLEWQAALYHPDLTHPGPAMTLLAGMCLFSAIYDQRVCAIHPDFLGGGPLVSWLTAIGVGADDWALMAPLADRSADPSLRPFPGSGDHLLLESGTPPGPTDACGQQAIGVGSYLVMRLSSKNGVFDQAPAWLALNIHANGSPPQPSAVWPELQLDAGGMLLLAVRPDLTSSLNVLLQMPFSFPGLSVLVQGIAFAPSTTTGNPSFATSDGHVLTFQ